MDFECHSQQVKKTKRRNAQNEVKKVVEIERITKEEKVLKKLLTKWDESGKIVKLSQERWQEKCRSEKAVEKGSKKFKKIFKNLLTR